MPLFCNRCQYGQTLDWNPEASGKYSYRCKTSLFILEVQILLTMRYCVIAPCYAKVCLKFPPQIGLRASNAVPCWGHLVSKGGKCTLTKLFHQCETFLGLFSGKNVKCASASQEGQYLGQQMHIIVLKEARVMNFY